MFNLEKVKFITHSQCMDGSTSCLVFLFAGGKKENVIFSNPSHDKTDEVVKEQMQTGLPIIMADISISLKLAQDIDTYDYPIIILDHHKSAEDLKKFSWCEIDNSRCGSKILFDYFMRDFNTLAIQLNSKCLSLVTLSDDYDRWIHDYPDSKKLNALHHLLGQELFIDRFLKNHDMAFTKEENYLVDLEDVKTQKMVNEKKKEAFVIEKQIQGHKVRIACVKAIGSNMSILGNELCKDPNINVDIAMMLGSDSVSFRCKDTCPVDLSVLAKDNNGGGHSRSSGINLNVLLGQDLLEMVLYKIKF